MIWVWPFLFSSWAQDHYCFRCRSKVNTSPKSEIFVHMITQIVTLGLMSYLVCVSILFSVRSLYFVVVVKGHFEFKRGQSLETFEHATQQKKSNDEVPILYVDPPYQDECKICIVFVVVKGHKRSQEVKAWKPYEHDNP